MLPKHLLKRKLSLIFFILLVIALAVAFFIYQNSPVEPLSPEAYKELEARLIALVESEDPRAALHALQAEIDRSESVLRSCHGLVHEIGHEAYEKYGDVAKAFSYRDEICGAGYIHGVIESYMDEKGFEESELSSICTSYVGEDRDNCFHGVGHGLMFYTRNDVPASITSCHALADIKARMRCAEGVFMENFESDDVFHLSEYVDDHDLFSICRSQKEIYQKGACYFYAPLYYLNQHERDYADMFALCREAEAPYISTCIKGTASRVTKENIERPSLIFSYCMKQRGYEGACVEGIGSYFYTHYGDKTKVKELCSQVAKDYISACTSTLK
jgi:hypothetical protein